jgi:hypothetical protein
MNVPDLCSLVFGTGNVRSRGRELLVEQGRPGPAKLGDGFDRDRASHFYLGRIFCSDERALHEGKQRIVVPEEDVGERVHRRREWRVKHGREVAVGGYGRIEGGRGRWNISERGRGRRQSELGRKEGLELRDGVGRPAGLLWRAGGPGRGMDGEMDDARVLLRL